MNTITHPTITCGVITHTSTIHTHPHTHTHTSFVHSEMRLNNNSPNVSPEFQKSCYQTFLIFLSRYRSNCVINIDSWANRAISSVIRWLWTHTHTHTHTGD